MAGGQWVSVGLPIVSLVSIAMKTHSSREHKAKRRRRPRSSLVVNYRYGMTIMSFRSWGDSCKNEAWRHEGTSTKSKQCWRRRPLWQWRSYARRDNCNSWLSLAYEIQYSNNNVIWNWSSRLLIYSLLISIRTSFGFKAYTLCGIPSMLIKIFLIIFIS